MRCRAAPPHPGIYRVNPRGFDARFRRCFSVFTLRAQLDPQQKHWLLKVDPRSTFRNVTTFFNPQETFLLRDKLITQSEKWDTSTKTCNETMLRDKLRVFVSRILPPLQVKGALSRYFSVILQCRNMFLYQWKPKNNDAVLLSRTLSLH